MLIIIFFDLPTLFAKRASTFSPAPQPSPGQGLNRSACRSYIKVSSTHHRVGMEFFIGWRGEKTLTFYTMVKTGVWGAPKLLKRSPSGRWEQKRFNTRYQLGVLKDEIGIDTEFGVETLGERHGDASAPTHNLTELGFVDAK